MARTDNKILALLGYSVTGDLGAWTFYTSSRGQFVFYPRMPALNPPTPRQDAVRAMFTAAAAAWKALTPNQRAQYELASRRACTRITGYNLWVHFSTTGDAATRATIARQSHTVLAAP